MSEAGEGNPRMLGSDMSKLKCQKECLDMPDDSICRICLSEFIVDSCQAQPCMHKFCFVCLVGMVNLIFKLVLKLLVFCFKFEY